MAALCLFDLDYTLLPIDSDHAWGEFLIELGWAEADDYRRRNDAFFELYKRGTLDIAAYVDFATAAWRTRPASELARAQRRFMQERIEPAIRPAARALVAEHLERGDLVAIITATNEFVTAPIAAAFGVEHLLAIRLERDASGTITGRVSGVPTFREGKVTRTARWLAERGARLADFERISVYSDSPNDLPLLDIATDPVATNPSRELHAVAKRRGWRVLKLFDDQEVH